MTPPFAPFSGAVISGNISSLHVVPSYLPATRYGGPTQSVHGLCRGLADTGNSVWVATTNIDGPGTTSVPLNQTVDFDGVSVVYAAVTWPRRIVRSPSLALTVESLLNKVSVVHLHSVFLWPTLVAARLAIRAGVPYVVSPRGMLVKDLIQVRSRLAKETWLRLYERKTIENASAIHVTAGLEADELKKFGWKLPRVEVIPNGVETLVSGAGDVSADVRGAVASGPYILAFGRINWKKNLAVAIAAVARCPGVRLIIAGPPEMYEDIRLRDEARKLNASNRVVIIARDVQGADKETLLRNCELLVMPSLSENFGNVALEAMSAGRPVVVSETAGISEIVRDYNAGIVTRPEAGSVVSAIRQLLNDPAHARLLGANGQRVARETLSWQTVAGRMLELYAAVSHDASHR